MTLESIRCPIVGSRFYASAEAILRVIGVNTPLLAIAEPTNPYDSNAIQVWIEVRNISQAALDRIPNSGALASASSWQLGHIARDFAAKLKSRNFPSELPGTFTIGNDGGPRIVLELETKEIVL